MYLLNEPARYLFFTGKGGVGKTTLACATAIALADAGKTVLLVSTDPASNLDEMLAVTLSNVPTPVPGVPRLSAMNIDPKAAADAYRQRVIQQMPASTEGERAQVREELSGACTTEIASFDEFAGLLTDAAPKVDHIIFDTAPTGHTLRLLSLPKAWTGFLQDNDRGASCLGPHSGLKMQESRFRTALATLSDPERTRIVLVTRADPRALAEAARTADDLNALGIGNQHLAINAVFHASRGDDPVAVAYEAQGHAALASMPASIRGLSRDEIPLRAFDMVGLPALRAVLSPPAAQPVTADNTDAEPESVPAADSLDQLVESLAQSGHGLIMVMGKGGVGKTSIAAALALGLVERGHPVHLSTTDPAAHLAATLVDAVPGLSVDRIDPKAETARYVEKIMAGKGSHLEPAARDLLREDLRSPCTEEVAVFHAFSRMVNEARSCYVILDTAPTGHTLLLLDATGAYHRQIERDMSSVSQRFVTPLMHLQDPDWTRIIVVTLPETTPVSEAAALQDDLRRAQIEPYAWVINRSMSAAHTRDPLLAERIAGERKQVERVRKGLAKRVYGAPWLPQSPTGAAQLRRLLQAPVAVGQPNSTVPIPAL
ncbi:MAG: arsenical pump-driving ATPase [Nevskia sp.]|jgi:arsenite-transporting ATPase|nr:arsenical pump-driving ATPase [Nevskia sp.]